MVGERAGKRVRKVVTLGGKHFALGPRCASFDGYNVHANVALAAHDRTPWASRSERRERCERTGRQGR